MITLVIISGAFALTIGVAILWANPERFTNQAFAGIALIAAVYAFCIYHAVKAGIQFSIDHVTSTIPMLRAGAAVFVFFPWLLWIQKESLVSLENNRLRIIRRSLPWFCLSVVLAIFCFSESYFPSDSLPSNERRGWSYAFVNLTLIGMFIYLICQSWYEMRRQSGIRRIEMQYLVFNSAIAALLAIGLALFSHFFQVPALRKSGQFMVIAVYGLAAWAVTYYRIFDIRQILVSLFQRVGVVVILGLGVFFGWKAIGSFLPQSVALMLSIGIFCSTCFWLDRRSREWLEIDGEHALSDMRQAVINIARAEPNTEKLGHEFERFLSEECNVPAAKLLFNQGKAYVAGNLEFPKARPGCVALCESGWATPESLTRRRATSGLTDLQLFFTNHSLGVMVASPRGSLSPSLILALKVKANEWPFTYPEVQRLQNVAELMDNILTHSRLTMQAAVQAKMEHLAMMSRGLAHDLNNLITPISSFLLHTDKGISPHSPEHEVHEAATRSVRVMTDYIREALFFSDRLSAKYETVDLSRILLDVYALTAARAAERGVVVKGVSDYNGKFTADAVLLQRLLVNLVGNAIDASNSGHKVTLSAALDRAGWLVLRVADEGSGISAENLERVFDPYFTTKRYGDNVRGFGLGLTICQKIVHLHGGTISVSSQPGHGTTVTIDIPLEQGGQTPEIGGPAR